MSLSYITGALKLSKKSTTSERESELATEVARLKRQLAGQAEDLAFLKKRSLNVRRVRTYTLIVQLREHEAAEVVCEVFDVPASSYYEHK